MTSPAPTPARPPDDGPPAATPARAESALTVPNAITVARILGSGVLLWLAHAGHGPAFVALFLVLVLTDWLDGKLAVLLDQRTVIGARLDSIGDAIMYAVLLVGTVWLEPAFVRAHAALIAAMLGTYALSVLIALVRFHRLPAYHTRAAKTCWLLTAIGGVTLLVGGPAWPARVAIVAVIITNLEAVALGLVLDRWRADVPSIVHALRLARHG